MGDFVHLLIFFGSTNVQPAKLPEIYGAPPQTYEGSMGHRPIPRTLFWKKRGKNNVLPQSIPLTSFVRYFAAFSVLLEL